MKQHKLLSIPLGALMLASMLPVSSAFADTNIPTIPGYGQKVTGQAYLNPANAPYQIGSLTSTLNVQAFYQGDPYTDPSNSIRREIKWHHSTSNWVNDPTAPSGISKVSFGLATVTLEDGSGRTGNFYLYNIDTLDSNNGYGLISKDDVPAWVQLLGGDINAINQAMADGTLDVSSYMDDMMGDTWNVVHLGQLAKLCGWTLAFDNGTDANNIGDTMNGMYVVADQTKAMPTFKLFPSPKQETIKLSPPSETVPSGTSVKLSYTVTGMQPGDTVKVTPSGNGTGMWRVSGDTKATDSATETEATTTNPITVSYTAVVIDKNGKQVASDTTTITWQPGKATKPLNPTDDQPGAWQNPVTQLQDYGVNLAPNIWDHWPRMGDTGHVDVKILNLAYNVNKDGDWIGGTIHYTITATSNNPYFEGFTKSGNVFVAPPNPGGDLDQPQPTVVTVPVDYTVAQRPDPRKGYIIQFKATVQSVETPGSKPPIPPLSDADPNNDTAIFNQLIPAAPVLTK